MKNFLKNIFANKKIVELREEESPLEVLSYAISDAGLFTWYNAELPEYAQLEFNRTMLYFEPKDSHSPPSNQIALQFRNIKSLSIYRDNESNLPDNWLELLSKDKLEPFNIDYEYFSFDEKEIDSMVNDFDNVEEIYTENVTQGKFVLLGFKAGDISLVIKAESMKIVSPLGDLKVDSILDTHHKWWRYWKKYWKVVNSKNKLPYDPLCEITIPAEHFKMK